MQLCQFQFCLSNQFREHVGGRDELRADNKKAAAVMLAAFGLKQFVDSCRQFGNLCQDAVGRWDRYCNRAIRRCVRRCV